MKISATPPGKRYLQLYGVHQTWEIVATATMLHAQIFPAIQSFSECVPVCRARSEPAEKLSEERQPHRRVSRCAEPVHVVHILVAQSRP